MIWWNNLERIMLAVDDLDCPGAAGLEHDANRHERSNQPPR